MSSNDKTTAEGSQLDYFTSLYGMKQVTTEPTHVLESSASCIDLIFTNQPNIVLDSGVHLSLYEKCHHQIIYSKRNLRIEYLHHISVKSGITIDLRQTQLIALLKFLVGLIYFQVKMCINK